MATATKPAEVQAPIEDVKLPPEAPKSGPLPQSKLKEFPEIAPPLEVLESKFSPEAQSAQQAAVKAWQRAQEPGQWINLPNGEAVRAQLATQPSYPDIDHLVPKMISNPELMLKEPLPQFGLPPVNGKPRSMPRYMWRKRDDPSTRNYHNAQRIRYVETWEVDPDSPYALHDEYQQPNATYVGRDTNILCEIRDPALSYQIYVRHEDKSILNISGLPQNIGHLKGEDQTTYRGSKTTLQIKDTARGA